MNPTGMNMIDLNLFSFGTGVDRESLQQYFKGIINKVICQIKNWIESTTFFKYIYF